MPRVVREPVAHVLERLVCMVGQLLRMAGAVDTPAWLTWMRSNKMAVIVAAFIASQVAARLTATGAFEVYFDGGVAGCVVCCNVRCVAAEGGIVMGCPCQQACLSSPS